MKDNDNSPVTRWAWVAILLVLFGSIGLLIYYVDILKNSRLPPGTGVGLPPEIVLGVVLVLGVIALVASLTFMTVTYKSLNLTNSNHSLGLPEGSVRAVIALSLILIFMISSVFLYYQVSQGHYDVSTGITQDQIDNFPQQNIIKIVYAGRNQSNESVFDVTTLIVNQSSVDIAKQIITTVSTLVVAIAGFYFGTQAVAVAKNATGISSPLIRKIEPPELPPGEKKDDFKIFGKDFETPQVKFVGESDTIECTNCRSNDTEIVCCVKIKDDAPPGKYTVIVTNADGGEDRLEYGFEIKEKKEEQPNP
jgi:hypothetical protein